MTLSHHNSYSTVFKISATDPHSSFTLSTDHLEATFHGSTGLLQSIKKQDSTDHIVRTNIDFIIYSSSSSGAYLFLPDGGAQVILLYSFSYLSKLATCRSHARFLEIEKYSFIL